LYNNNNNNNDDDDDDDDDNIILGEHYPTEWIGQSWCYHGYQI